MHILNWLLNHHHADPVQSSRRVEDDIKDVSRAAVDSYNDEELRETFLASVMQL